jgi:uncharacterized protein (TIGR02246 family)
MTTTGKSARWIGAIAAAAACSLGAVAADTAGDIKALQAVDAAWVKAFNAGDADGMANSYDEKAVLLPPGAPAVHGRAAIKALLAKESAGAKQAGVIYSLDDKPAGGVSGAMGWQSGAYAVKDKSGKVLETGKYLSVSMKKGGKWLYVRDTWNADSPPPAPAPAAAAPAPAAPKK